MGIAYVTGAVNNNNQKGEQMKQIIKALKGQRVEVKFCGEAEARSGIIQSVRGDCATVSDCFGGAWGLTISEVKGIRIDQGQPALIVVENWQQEQPEAIVEVTAKGGECGFCNGTGKSFSSPNADCRACHGTGKLTAEREADLLSNKPQTRQMMGAV